MNTLQSVFGYGERRIPCLAVDIRKNRPDGDRNLTCLLILSGGLAARPLRSENARQGGGTRMEEKRSARRSKRGGGDGGRGLRVRVPAAVT